MRQQPINSWSVLKLRQRSSGSKTRNYLLYFVLFILFGYLISVSWFALNVLDKSHPDEVDGSPKKGDPVIRQPKDTSSQAAVGSEDDIHIVFSTGCNLFQHWQAEVLLYSHLKVGQKGKITRVVSGCDTEAQKREHAKFLTHPEGLGDDAVPYEELLKSSHPNFRLHVTPSFPGAREFPWINKPMGLAHWLQNADPPVKESIIVIIDPDQFFMDKLRIDGSRTVKGSRTPYGKNGLLCTAGCRNGKSFNEDVQGKTDIVRKGRPVAQTYGLGGSFVFTYNVTKIVGVDSPARQLQKQRASQHYSVGPPMMVHIEDMRNIMKKWVEYMNPVFVQNPGDIQADMYAYSFAAAHYGLDHQMFDQYMVSSPLIEGEAWPFVDQYLDSAICSNPNQGAREPEAAIPTFLHVAQRYDSDLTDFMWHKGHVPPNIFRCDLPLLIMPPDDIIKKAPSHENKQKMYMLCNAYVLVNEALLAWKKKYCVQGEAYNTKQAIMLQKHTQQCLIKEEKGNKCWIFARVIDNNEE